MKISKIEKLNKISPNKTLAVNMCETAGKNKNAINVQYTVNKLEEGTSIDMVLTVINYYQATLYALWKSFKWEKSF